MNKIVYAKQNGKEIILDKSDLCPISGNWLIPANCIEIQPPKVEEGYKVKFENGKWLKEKTEEKVQEEEIKKYEPVVKTIQEQIDELKSQIEELKNELKKAEEKIKEGD